MDDCLYIDGVTLMSYRYNLEYPDLVATTLEKMATRVSRQNKIPVKKVTRLAGSDLANHLNQFNFGSKNACFLALEYPFQGQFGRLRQVL